MSDQKSGSDDLDAMLEELEAEADQHGGDAEGVSDDEMAELEKMLSESSSPSKEAADAKKKKSGQKPTLADEWKDAESELEGLDLDAVPEEEEGGGEAELPDDVGGEIPEKEPEKPSGEAKQAQSKQTSQKASDSTQQEVQKPPAESQEASPAQQGDSGTQSEDETEGAGAESGGRAGRMVLGALKWMAYSLPSLMLFWVVGSYLGRWITAGWLIGAVSMLVTVGLPILLYDAVGRKGAKRWWLAGSGLLLTALLVAPMPSVAGNAVAHHGHWPGELADEIGMADDNLVSKASWSAGQNVAGWLGVTLDDQQSYTALGSMPAAEKSDAGKDAADAGKDSSEGSSPESDQK